MAAAARAAPGTIGERSLPARPDARVGILQILRMHVLKTAMLQTDRL